MTIHQPNAELLSLFDDVILLVNGGCVYTGTVAGAAKHFNELEGKDIIVPGVPVTETSLRLADTTFNHHITENYPARYGHSTVRADLATKITAYQAERQSISVGQSFGDHIVQFWTLVMRLLVVAKRDLTLFYVQYFLSGEAIASTIPSLFPVFFSHSLSSPTFRVPQNYHFLVQVCMDFSSV